MAENQTDSDRMGWMCIMQPETKCSNAKETVNGLMIQNVNGVQLRVCVYLYVYDCIIIDWIESNVILDVWIRGHLSYIYVAR